LVNFFYWFWWYGINLSILNSDRWKNSRGGYPLVRISMFLQHTSEWGFYGRWAL
jgi:hypothetical protein